MSRLEYRLKMAGRLGDQEVLAAALGMAPEAAKHTLVEMVASALQRKAQWGGRKLAGWMLSEFRREAHLATIAERNLTARKVEVDNA